MIFLTGDLLKLSYNESVGQANIAGQSKDNYTLIINLIIDNPSNVQDRINYKNNPLDSSQKFDNPY